VERGGGKLDAGEDAEEADAGKLVIFRRERGVSAATTLEGSRSIATSLSLEGYVGSSRGEDEAGGKVIDGMAAVELAIEGRGRDNILLVDGGNG
jgi:hypothetical protein